MKRLIISIIFIMLSVNILYCQEDINDTIVKIRKNNIFRKLAGYIYTDRNSYIDSIDFYFELLNKNRGKTIASIQIQPLEVFGPTFSDTLRQPQTKIAKLGNTLQTKTNPKIIMRNIIINVGDTVDMDAILENERVIRSLPYIQDVRFVVLPCENDTNMVNINVITKDVFSFGAGVNIGSLDHGELKLYNHNIWGIGHQVSATVVGHTEKEPFIGWEASYAVRHIGVHKVNMKSDYYNTFRRKGFIVNLEKEFLYMNTKWGGGTTVTHLDRTNYLVGYDNIISDTILNYSIYDFWSGYGFLLNKNKPYSPQFVLSARFCDFNFEEPYSSQPVKSYYSDSKLFLGSISISRRDYSRDKLIYSYGITEDIPKGFLHEYVFGYEKNKYVDNWYSHLYFSSGNLLHNNHGGYLFGSFGIGGFFNKDHISRGQIEYKNSYISRLHQLGTLRYRQFIQLHYVRGFNRYDEEFLYLRDDGGVRGLNSNLVRGKQKIALNTESVFFQDPEFFGFKLAFFNFIDMGLIGDQKSIFPRSFYSGFGLGIRLRNENLVFNTLQLRLSFYPKVPSDVGRYGLSFVEIGRNTFYRFQPRKPAPLNY